MVALETIIRLSFDDTLPVPALASRFALPRESVVDLFERCRVQSQLHWENGDVWIRPEDERGWDQADCISRIDIEDVEVQASARSHATGRALVAHEW